MKIKSISEEYVTFIYIYIQGKPTEYKKLLHCFINEEFTAADAQQHQHMHVFPLVDYNAALESLKSRLSILCQRCHCRVWCLY